MMNYGRIALGTAMLLLVVSILFVQPGDSTITGDSSGRSPSGLARQPVNELGDVEVSDPVSPELSGPARDLPPYSPEPMLDREINPRQDPYGRSDPEMRIIGGPDPLLGIQAGASGPTDSGFGTPIFNFDGQGHTNFNPPDTVGDVGADHYIQMINGAGTGVAIYDKHTGTLVQSFSLTSLGGCSTGNGDPIVLFDHAADRWFLSEFGPGTSLCIFISTTPDPQGTYYSYQFSTPGFPDYPKYAVWPDAYYATTIENSPSSYALDRTAMLAGNPAASQRFTAPDLSGFGFQAMTPGDWDGATPPPVGAPNYIMRHVDTEAHGPAGYPTEDFLEVWAFHVDWSAPANSSFAQVANISVAEFDSDLCGLHSLYAIAMPGVPKCSTSSLDPLREVVMWRLQYRNFGPHETLVGNLATDVSGNDDAGVRWFELRKIGAGVWGLHQEGTYAPDGDSRWMGAIAMDGTGNIALGYNVSSLSTYPSLRYAGRLASDNPGTLPQGEHVLVDGSASNWSNRYGDYAAMSVDPVDDCTFWFTGEYNVTSDWSTRIGAFKFDACGRPDFTLAVDPLTQATCVGSDVTYDINVGSVKDYDDPVTFSASGNPAGTSVDFSVSPVIPPGSSILTVGNTGSAAAGDYAIEILGVAPTSTHTTTVGLEMFDSSPSSTTLLAPAYGAINVSLAPQFVWAPVSGNAVEYLIEVATDDGFSNVVFSALVDDTSATSSVSLEQLTQYYWRVQATNPCGSGPWSTTFSFITAQIPPILLVDDDNNNPDVQGFYTDALDALAGAGAYDIWDTNNGDDEPDAAELSAYDVVIWFTGAEFGGFAGPGSSGEAALATWLDGGGCFLISSQDYHWDRDLTAFMEDYLGVASVVDDVGQTSVTGMGSVFSGLGPYALNYPSFSNYSDIVNPDGTAELSFSGDIGDAAVNKGTDDYKSTFWGFSWEAIPSAGERQNALTAFFDWCGDASFAIFIPFTTDQS